MIEQFRDVATPRFHSFIGTRSDLTNFSWAVAESGTRELAVRTVRGAKMRTSSALFDEFAAVFQFPDYFGENWNALKECLADLSWLEAAGYVLFVRDAISIVASEDPVVLPIFFNVLDGVASEWAVPVSKGEAWDRPAKPFHIVLHAVPSDTAKLSTLLSKLGKPISDLTDGRP